MTITVGGTSITFSDSTTQSTAAVSSAYVGNRGQAFTSNGTFTIPAGVTAVKVTVLGGGGAGGYFDCGGTGSPSNAGGNSTVASGTQSISTITGGAGGIDLTAGTATGGTLNLTFVAQGNYGSTYANTTNQIVNFNSPYGQYGRAGSGAGGCGSGGGAGGMAITYLTSLTPGGTLAVTIGAGGTTGTFGGQVGGAGLVLFEW